MNLGEQKDIDEDEDASTILIHNTKEVKSDIDDEESELEEKLTNYRDVFDFYDWNSTNTIPISVSKCVQLLIFCRLPSHTFFGCF